MARREEFFKGFRAAKSFNFRPFGIGACNSTCRTVSCSGCEVSSRSRSATNRRNDLGMYDQRGQDHRLAQLFLIGRASGGQRAGLGFTGRRNRLAADHRETLPDHRNGASYRACPASDRGDSPETTRDVRR